MNGPVTVLKIGGSVLTGPHAYRRAAAFIGARLCVTPGERLVAVVSAELGVTDALLATAREIVETPGDAALDLLWYTGELRSAALLALSLQALGVRVAAAGIHQAGLVQTASGGGAAGCGLNPLRLRALLAEHDVVVAPGFFARGAGDAVVSLGRGGSDLTAVMVAAGLGAASCELLKDVPGYFTADPHCYPDARLIPALSYARALAMADAGCELVQRHALEAARAHRLPLVVRAIGGAGGTRVHDAPIED
jgi:aspartate kinase